jgi:hypothetical protein
MMLQTYRIVTPCFLTALDAADAAIATRDDDDDSTREIVAVRVLSALREIVGGRVSMPLAAPPETLSREKCQWVT